MNIRFGKGLEPEAWFGIGPEILIKRFGEPDRAFELERDEDEKRRHEMEYNSIQTRFRLYEDRVGWIQTSNSELQLLGHTIMGKKPAFVAQLLEAAGYGEPEYTQYDSFGIHFWDFIWFEVQFEYDRVKDVNFGVLIDDETDEYVWPSSEIGW